MREKYQGRKRKMGNVKNRSRKICVKGERGSGERDAVWKIMEAERKKKERR